MQPSAVDSNALWNLPLQAWKPAYPFHNVPKNNVAIPLHPQWRCRIKYGTTLSKGRFLIPAKASQSITVKDKAFPKRVILNLIQNPRHGNKTKPSL